MCYRSEPIHYVVQPQIWYHNDYSPELIAFRVAMAVVAVFGAFAAAVTNEPAFLIISFIAIVAAICPRILFEIDWSAPPAYRSAYRQPSYGQTHVHVHQSAPAPSASASYYPAASTFGTSYSAPAYSAPPLSTHTVALVDESALQRRTTTRTSSTEASVSTFVPDPAQRRTQIRDPNNPYDVRGYNPSPARKESPSDDSLTRRTQLRSAGPLFLQDSTQQRTQTRPRS